MLFTLLNNFFSSIIYKPKLPDHELLHGMHLFLISLYIYKCNMYGVSHLDAHVVAPIVPHVSDVSVHLPLELGNVGEHADGPGDAAAGMEH